MVRKQFKYRNFVYYTFSWVSHLLIYLMCRSHPYLPSNGLYITNLFLHVVESPSNAIILFTVSSPLQYHSTSYYFRLMSQLPFSRCFPQILGDLLEIFDRFSFFLKNENFFLSSSTKFLLDKFTTGKKKKCIFQFHFFFSH